MKKKAIKKKRHNRKAHSQPKTVQGKHSKTKPHYSVKTMTKRIRYPEIEEIRAFHKNKAIFAKLEYYHSPCDDIEDMKVKEEFTNYLADQYAYYQPTKPIHFVLINTMKNPKGEYCHYLIMDKIRQEVINRMWVHGEVTISQEPPGIDKYQRFKPSDIIQIRMSERSDSHGVQ